MVTAGNFYVVSLYLYSTVGNPRSDIAQYICF